MRFVLQLLSYTTTRPEAYETDKQRLIIDNIASEPRTKNALPRRTKPSSDKKHSNIRKYMIGSRFSSRPSCDFGTAVDPWYLRVL